MEQQNKLTEEEKAYQTLRTQDMQDMPDLWSRIDAGFEEEVTKQKAAQKKGRTRQLVLVAAAVLIVIIAVPIGISSMRKSNTKEMATEARIEEMDDMADETAAAETAPSNNADASAAADSEILDSSDESMNHVDSNGITEAQTDEAVNTDNSGKTNSEERNDTDNQVSYQTITQVILTQYDAQGNIVQQFDSVDTDGAIDKVQFRLEAYEVLDWKPADMIQSDVPYYLMELKLQNGSSVANVYYEGEKFEGKTVADLMMELQKLKK